MKIAIIGGGFYGCHYALKIAKNFTNCTIDLYERNRELMLNAISNNQHRLHLGYHYPRCNFTIEQSIRSHNKFISEYNNCVENIKQNLYIVHKNSHVDYEQYVKIFNYYGLKHEKVDKIYFSNLLSNLNDIEGVLSTEEKKINLTKLTKQLKLLISLNKNINVKINTKIDQITNSSEILIDEKLSKYDFILNTTYYNPSMGLTNNKIPTKSELCFLTLLKDKKLKFKDIALTVCDGEFASLYPADEDNTFTLSNVKYTPYFKSDSFEEIFNIKNNLKENEIKEINSFLFNDSKKYLNINENDFDVIRTYISIKTKILKDTNDYRGSYYIREKNNISFMCGKISAALDLENDIIKELKNG